MTNQKLLNIINRINEFHFWLIGYLESGLKKDEADLCQKLERNINSMKAIIEKCRKRGDMI